MIGPLTKIQRPFRITSQETCDSYRLLTKGVNTMTDRAGKLKTLSLNSFYYFTGGQWHITPVVSLYVKIRYRLPQDPPLDSPILED